MMFVIRVFPGNLEPGYIRKGGVGWVYTADLLEAFCWINETDAIRVCNTLGAEIRPEVVPLTEGSHEPHA
jgi:hypothetical protein